MGKINFFTGIGLIALGGVLFTIERLIAVILYSIDTLPVKLDGNGTIEPINMPGLFENFYVGFLLILGLVLFGTGATKLFIEK